MKFLLIAMPLWPIPVFVVLNKVWPRAAEQDRTERTETET